MKKIFLLPLLLIALLCFGQTQKHVKIPGTKCSLIPPAGFVVASSFSGFQNAETGASIMVNEIPAPYQSLADGFTADALSTKGMALTSKQIIDFNNSKATLVNVTQAANGTTYIKQILIFGNLKNTVLVNGIYPEASKEIVEGQIKEALLSAIYDAAQNENPLEAATFTIDITGTALQLVKYMSGSLLYSANGKIPTEKPTLIVSNSLSKTSPPNRKQYAEERLKQFPGGEHIVIKEVKEITIDNLKGYEIVATGKTKDNKPELNYMVMLFADNGDYYIILGRAKEDFDKNLDSFKKVAKTFKRK
jgi:hypothetical protein